MLHLIIHHNNNQFQFLKDTVKNAHPKNQKNEEKETIS
jgi:hypothetical protein